LVDASSGPQPQRQIESSDIPGQVSSTRATRRPKASVPILNSARFFFIGKHVLSICDVKGDRTDQEMEEIYAMFRRRPDGRSLGVVHDLLRQVAALLLGIQALSAAEFEVVFGTLERSARKWALRPISRFYVAYLHQTLE
jgi:hypothetical protein